VVGHDKTVGMISKNGQKSETTVSSREVQRTEIIRRTWYVYLLKKKTTKKENDKVL